MGTLRKNKHLKSGNRILTDELVLTTGDQVSSVADVRCKTHHKMFKKFREVGET